MSDLRKAAQQALEALESDPDAIVEVTECHWDYKRDLAIAALRQALAEPEREPVNKYCCHACFSKSGQFLLDRMILCPECGNKRCPKAAHHDLPCTNSNEPGQEGSIYTAPTPQPDTDCHRQGVCQRSGYSIAPTSRRPLTDEQIAAIASTPCAVVGSYVHTFARAIERSHGIGEQT